MAALFHAASDNPALVVEELATPKFSILETAHRQRREGDYHDAGIQYLWAVPTGQQRAGKEGNTTIFMLNATNTLNIVLASRAIFIVPIACCLLRLQGAKFPLCLGTFLDMTSCKCGKAEQMARGRNNTLRTAVPIMWVRIPARILLMEAT